MTLKKRIIFIISTLSLGINLVPTSVYARLVACGDSSESCTTGSIKTASIEWEYGESEHEVNTTTSSTGSTSVSYSAGSKLKNKKTGSWKFDVYLDASGIISSTAVSISGHNDGLFYNGTEHLGTDSRSPDGEQCPKGYKKITKSFSGTTVTSCEKVNILEYGSYYATLGDGNIRIKIDGGKIVDSDGGSGGSARNTTFVEELTCDIKGGKGNTLSAFNDSLADCASKLDKWVGHKKTSAGVADNSKTYEFGKITTSDTEGGTSALNEEGKSEGEAIAAGDSSSSGAGDAGEEEPCYDNAGVMGWIMCPVISIMSGFASQIYEDIATKYLEVEANGIFENNGSTYKAWSAFRDVANVAFVVLFLIVIISQLTGIGIDNYGIKRILPRIVIAAILINLSYFICQLVVDIANIAGQAIGGLLSPANLGITFPGGGASGTASYVVSLLVVGAGAAAGAAAMGGATAIVANLSLVMTALGPAGVIMCVLAVLSVVISVLFLWLTLVARQSVVVMLVVLSPLALACYLLPNTESIFRRYIKAATGVLLLYPICELVINGGQLAGVILANVSDGGSFSLAAMIVQVVPYFLIPGLLKNSMSAIGNLGAKISSVGSTVRGAYNRARKSDFAQDALANATIGNSKRKIEAIRTLKKRPGGRAISKALGQRQGRAMKRVSDNLGQDLDLESAAMQLGFSQNDDYQQMQIAARRQHALEEDSKIYASKYSNSSDEALESALRRTMGENNEESGELEGIINTYMANRNYDGLYDALKNASAAGASSSAMQRAAKAMRDNRNFSELSKKRTSLGEWAKGKIDDSHDIADAAYDNVDSFKPKDWAAMNGKEREEAFKALDTLKQVADGGDAQAAARYKEALNNMRAAADNEQLRADMKDDVVAEYRRYAGPAQTSTPIARQAPGANASGGTLEVRNSNQLSSSSRQAISPSWAERESRNAVQSGSGVLLTGEDSRAGLNLPGNNNNQGTT